ncbi:hypothetical protein [Roseomonas sp. BN140053]|uniref:hypothetical protein n=1 Tax=Roseomonas sp. BN140053 TaxID=3391898 RepID=UPI0039E9E498
MTGEPKEIRVNRAPVLTLWAAVVAERLGLEPDAAMTLGRAVAGSSARAKAKAIGIEEEDRKPAAPHDDARRQEPKPRARTVHLLGRDVPVVEEKGRLRALDGGEPGSARAALGYVQRAFGGDLPAVRQAMEALARSLEPEELNRVGFRLYEHFRPEVAPGAKGWGAKGILDLDRIRGAAG